MPILTRVATAGLVLGALLASASQASSAPPGDPAPVIAAERAFARDAGLLGAPESFLKWSDPDAIIIDGRGPWRVHDRFAGAGPGSGRPAPTLDWWPVWAGVSAASDMGFTTGGFTRDGTRAGHYFTVWTRRADGRWNWVYDGGSPAESTAASGPGSEPLILPVSSARSASSAEAFAEIKAAEAAFAAEAIADQKGAHLRLLADEARLYIDSGPPALGRSDFSGALDRWPAGLTFGAPDGGGAAASGDLGWVHGPVRWTAGDGAGQGHYLHLWQKRPEGWRLLFAQIIPLDCCSGRPAPAAGSGPETSALALGPRPFDAVAPAPYRLHS